MHEKDDAETRFFYLAQRNKGNKFIYECPSCLCYFGIRQRITLNKRHCPACGLEVSVKEIDRQTKAKMPRGCLAIFDTLFKIFF